MVDDVASRTMRVGRFFPVADAVRRHEGERAASRNRFNALSVTEQRQLLNYLNSI